MRRKIMVAGMSVMILMAAVSLFGCGKSAKETKEAKTTTAQEKKTTTAQEKKSKKEKKIDIKILSKYDEIKDLLAKYPKDLTAEQAKYQGMVTIEQEAFDKKSKKLWNQFLKSKIERKKNSAIIICQFTTEGDAILQYVSYIDGKFYYVEDSTRDTYSSEKYIQYSYGYQQIYRQDGHYIVLLTTDNKLTFDEAQDVRSLKTAVQLLDVKE